MKKLFRTIWKNINVVFLIIAFLIVLMLLYNMGIESFITEWQKLPPFPIDAIIPIIIFSLIVSGITALLTNNLKKQNNKFLQTAKFGDKCYSSRTKGTLLRIEKNKAYIEVEVEKHNIYPQKN